MFQRLPPTSWDRDKARRRPGLARSGQSLICLGLPGRWPITTKLLVIIPWYGRSFQAGLTHSALTRRSMSPSWDRIATSASNPDGNRSSLGSRPRVRLVERHQTARLRLPRFANAGSTPSCKTSRTPNKHRSSAHPRSDRALGYRLESSIAAPTVLATVSSYTDIAYTLTPPCISREQNSVMLFNSTGFVKINVELSRPN